MRLAIVASYTPSLVLFRGPLIREMIARGHSVIAFGPEDDPAVSSALQEMGVHFQPYRLFRAGVNPVTDLRTLASLVRHFRRERPDIFLGYTIKPVIYGSLAASLARIPQRFSMITGLGFAFTSSANGTRKRKIAAIIARRLYQTSLRLNGKVFFQNPDDRAEFIQMKIVRPDQAVLINGTGVDLDYYAAIPLQASPPSFLLIARLLADKGIREYVEAARILKARYPDARFRLVGPFDPNPAAIARVEVEQWQREGVVEYLGETKDVRPFIADCSVYVLPSYREGTPRTVLEAMAMGRPIITTDAPGCRETTVHGDNGFLVPPRDAPSLAAAMEQFIEHPELIAIMGKRSREIAKEKYDVHKVNEVILRTMGLIS